jgi:hypothetical protein
MPRFQKIAIISQARVCPGRPHPAPFALFWGLRVPPLQKIPIIFHGISVVVPARVRPPHCLLSAVKLGEPPDE